MRVCILLAKSIDPATESEALNGLIPRPEYLVLKEALDSDLLDYSDVEASTHPLVVRARRRGLRFGLAMLGVIHRKDYDHFYCTGEDIALPFATLMTGLGDFGRITAVIHNSGTPKRHAWMRAIPSITWRNIICIGEEQYRVVVEENRVPQELVHLFPFWVDTRFYDPGKVTNVDGEASVLACGRESRDYAVLQSAAAHSELPFRIVASGWAPHQGFDVAGDIHETANVAVFGGALTYVELRAQYAAARVVAVPVQCASYGAGVTSIVEAMCMEKPVVVSASPGIVDYVDHDVSGLLVPVGDPDAMRGSLEMLFRDPDRCEAMGRHGRAHALRHLRVELHAERVAGLFGLSPRTGALTRPDDRP